MDNKFFARIYCIYDSKAEVYSKSPFVCPSRPDAIRGFESECNSKDSTFNKYPADFTLFEIGSWDERTGTIDLYGAKISVGLALDFVKVPQSV